MESYTNDHELYQVVEHYWCCLVELVTTVSFLDKSSGVYNILFVAERASLL